MQQGDERLPFLAHEEEEREAPSAGGLLLRALGALLLIVGLIVAAAWGMKRFGGGRFGASEADAPALRVLTSVALGDKRSLAVVRFGGRTLLVGSTAQSLTLLAEDDAAIDEDALSAALPARSVAELLEDEITEGALVFPAPEAVPHSFAGELSIARQRYAAPAAMPPFSKGASNV